jgi:hypothetical protein
LSAEGDALAAALEKVVQSLGAKGSSKGSSSGSAPDGLSRASTAPPTEGAPHSGSEAADAAAEVAAREAAATQAAQLSRSSSAGAGAVGSGAFGAGSGPLGLGLGVARRWRQTWTLGRRVDSRAAMRWDHGWVVADLGGVVLAGSSDLIGSGPKVPKVRKAVRGGG